MTYTYTPKGVCSRKMTVELDEGGVIKAVRVDGGCSGNLQGISRLVVGMTAQKGTDGNAVGSFLLWRDTLRFMPWLAMPACDTALRAKCFCGVHAAAKNGFDFIRAAAAARTL